MTGPWVYSSLQQFIKLYLNNKKQISIKDIIDFVDKYYITVNSTIKKSIVKQLVAYQHNIFKKQEYTISEFQQDQWDNQFTLYKHNDHKNYEDTGEIWVRMKNYPLSVPLMNYTVLFNNNYSEYYNDPYDTLQCDTQINYANMLKQLTNNAVKFGVISNVMWILGYTNYIIVSNKLTKDDNNGYLKLCCFKYYLNEELNALKIDLTSFKFQTYDITPDYLNGIDEFIGAYFNQYDNGIDFVLYDKQKHVSNIKSDHKSSIIITSYFTEIPITISKYYFDSAATNINELNLSGMFPAINLASGEFINDFPQWKLSAETAQMSARFG